ncbi:MAG: hypothetical protein WCI04_07525 [archaeon]
METQASASIPKLLTNLKNLKEKENKPMTEQILKICPQGIRYFLAVTQDIFGGRYEHYFQESGRTTKPTDINELEFATIKHFDKDNNLIEFCHVSGNGKQNWINKENRTLETEIENQKN